MKALVVFHDNSDHPLSWMLEPGFRHVSVVVDDGYCWVLIDPHKGVPVIQVLGLNAIDIAARYRDVGAAVVETETRETKQQFPFALANCVGVVKAVIGLRAPMVWTPHQLYKRLTC